VEGWTPEQLTYMLKFRHPEKLLAGMPGMSESVSARVFGISPARYRRLRGAAAERVRTAAAELLADPAVAPLVQRLPFRPGQTLVGLGDSITDDLESWVEILRALIAAARPELELTVINAGVSGDCTPQLISRFLDVARSAPDWILCLAGTNDARRHGRRPVKTLVSLEETERNLVALREFAATETAANWVWLTPPPVVEERIAEHWFLGAMELAWRNHDLRAVAAAIRRQPDAVVDLQPVFGSPPDPALLLPDGLHPSLAGQSAIVRALLHHLHT